MKYIFMNTDKVFYFESEDKLLISFKHLFEQRCALNKKHCTMFKIKPLLIQSCLTNSSQVRDHTTCQAPQSKIIKPKLLSNFYLWVVPYTTKSKVSTAQLLMIRQLVHSAGLCTYFRHNSYRSDTVSDAGRSGQTDPDTLGGLTVHCPHSPLCILLAVPSPIEVSDNRLSMPLSQRDGRVISALLCLLLADIFVLAKFESPS